MKVRTLQAVGLLLITACVVAMRLEGTPQANLRGTVVDVAGAVISNAELVLHLGKDEWYAATDATGRFDFPALPPGIYDLEVSRLGFRKQVIRSIRISTSGSAPITISMQVANPSENCGRDFFSRSAYEDATGQSGIRGVVNFFSYREVTDSGGNKRSVSSVESARGVTVSVVEAGSNNKPRAVRTNENGEFRFANLEPGLYVLKASGENYADFAASNVRVRPGAILEVEFSMQPPCKSGCIVVCQ